jgi:hypothetical protein
MKRIQKLYNNDYKLYDGLFMDLCQDLVEMTGEDISVVLKKVSSLIGENKPNSIEEWDEQNNRLIDACRKIIESNGKDMPI